MGLSAGEGGSRDSRATCQEHPCLGTCRARLAGLHDFGWALRSSVPLLNVGAVWVMR